MNKIRDRFRQSEHVYKNFLEILHQYRHSQKGIHEVYDQACVAQLAHLAMYKHANNCLCTRIVGLTLSASVVSFAASSVLVGTEKAAKTS